MKSLFTLLLALSVSFCGLCQTLVQLQNTKSKSEIIVNEENLIMFTTSIDDIFLDQVKFKGEHYTKIVVPEYYPDNIVGNPELPAFTKLLEVPLDAEFEINIISYQEQEIELSQYGFDLPIYPSQPAAHKNIDPETIPLAKNKNIYSNKEYYATELVRVENLSKMRGIQVAQVIVSPFSYDIETNTLTVKNNLQIEIKFKNPNIAKTKKIKAEKYSPAFEQSYSKMWNYKPKTTKNSDPISKYPIKYVIVSNRMFENALQPFIKWKTKKGFNVIVAYTDEIGSTTSAIKNYLQGLYDSGTETNPAPSYLLIVGDVAQVPTFSRTADYGSHPTDLYYCTFDESNDYIPEMYFGRFSATNVSQLTTQINKTLMYEQFTFPDPSYLENSMFVVGFDNTWSPNYGNGQVNYATTYYFNEDRDLNVTAYMHPQAKDKLNDIINIMNNGVGYVNYTAHCDASGWADPTFNTQKVKTLTNANEYFFSVGNCCLSNKFNDSECFGEALLRAENSGAVAHLGGSNSTIWHEDYYWSVGLSNNFVPNPTYESTGPGTYDNLFHKNGETPYITAGQMNYGGNMAVTSSTSTYKQYYWEIYHVMGDPSLMPYVGIPEELEVEVDDFITIGVSDFIVKTEPDAYVALSNNGKLLSAALADSSGEAVLEFDPVMEVGSLDIVITKQFRQPYMSEIDIILQENNTDAAIGSIVLPTTLLHISESEFSPSVTLLNLGLQDLTSAVVGYTINGEDGEEINWTGELKSLENEIIVFNEISMNDGVYEILFYVNNPNKNTDENENNNTRKRKIQIYSGNASISNVVSPDATICNKSSIAPEITITNKDKYPITSLTCTFRYGNQTDEFVWEGNIAAGESQNIKFPEQSKIESGVGIMEFSLSNPNGGTNITSGTTNINKEFYLVRTGQTLKLELKTDNYPGETSWELIDDDSSMVLFSEDSYSENNKTHTHEWCLGPGCYTFKIYDAGNDGMSGWYGYGAGSAKITNTSTNETILNLSGSGFSSSYSKSFCIELIECPLDKEFLLDDETNKLTGGLPIGGTYSGDGVEDNNFDPSVAGAGIHIIKYEYTTTKNQKLECEFEIKVADFYTVNCPEDMEVDYRDEKFLLDNATPEGGIFIGEGIEDNYFDPTSVEMGEYTIMYQNTNILGDIIECEFKIFVKNIYEIETETQNSNIKIYPNPVNNILTIKSEENINIEVINILGQTVKNISSSDIETKIDMSSYSDGTYFIKIIGNNVNTTKKIVLKK